MGTSRSTDITVFTGLRVAGTVYTPAHSKNGNNISQKLEIDAFRNTAKRGDGAVKKNESITLVVWGKMADTCAKSLSQGKEFHCHANINVYRGKVFKPSLITGQPGEIATDNAGNPLMTKKISFNIIPFSLSFGDESREFINKEKNSINAMGQPVRGQGWNIDGHPDQAMWLETIKARQAEQFNPALPTFGFADVRMPAGPGIGAYVPKENANVQMPAQPGPAMNTAQHVAATLQGMNPAQAIPQPVQPVHTANTTVTAGGFVIPNGV